jgi:hypothetical protein
MSKKTENQNVDVESKTDNNEMIDSDKVECVFTVEVVEKKVYEIIASTKKEALSIVNETEFLDNPVKVYSFSVRKQSLQLMGYRMKK